MPLSNMNVGFIGLGLMGTPMAEHLRRAGAALTVHNRTAAKTVPFAQAGAHAAETPRDLAERVGDGFIIICVSDTESLTTTLLGRNGVLAGMSRGATVIDMGTSEVSVTRKLAAQINVAGGHYIDAPVSGGEVAAKAGELSIMVGGDALDIELAMPLFEVLGKSVTHIGPVGTGQAAKVANQMIVGATICAVAEALALAKAAGADVVQVRNALLSGFAGSRILELHGQRMIDEEFTPGARATTQLKDMRQALALAGEVEVTLPMMTQCCALWTNMVDTGLGGLDHAGYAKFVQKMQD
jgi:3-hydroxyisobutyrate dehydrogenase-like beta-hydroxyacid dehydrogenase